MTLTVTFFIPPNGRQEVKEITGVYAPDEEFFKKYGVKISMEVIGSGQVAAYADTGKITDGEPDELIELSNSRTCEETLKSLCLACQKRFDDEGYPNEHR